MNNSSQLHIVTGSAGSGKSTFGRDLAAKLSAAFLDSDTVTEPVVRAGLTAAGMTPTDRDSPAYKRIFRDAVYDCLFATAQENLPHVSVVIVGPFTRELKDAGWPEQLNERFGVKPIIWYCHCEDQIRRQRIEKRANPRDAGKLDNWEQHVAEAPVVEPMFDTNRVNTS